MALLMFDYDGVIVDSLQMHAANFMAACRSNGFTALQTQGDLLKLYDGNIYEAMLNCGLDSSTIDQILSDYQVKQSEHLDGLQLFDGMASALKRIAADHKLFIITSNLSDAPMQVLERNGINCIEEVIGAEKEKSKIKKIQMTMKKYPHLLAYYIGDTKGDIIEGKKAGAFAIGAAWGWHGPERLKEAAPDHIFHSPQELAAFFAC